MLILVIGDVCEDHHYMGVFDRKNPESDAPLMKQTQMRVTLGMAANVANNLQAFCPVVFEGPPPPHSRKSRYYADDGVTQLLRVDVDAKALPYAVRERAYYERFDALVISDYAKGFITADVIRDIIARFDGPIFVDTKLTNLKPLSGPIYKINSTERLRLMSEPDELVVTCGAGGCWYMDENFPAPVVDAVDVCGAGDTFLAALAHEFTKTGDMPSALMAANHYAALACTRPGVYVLKKGDLQ